MDSVSFYNCRKLTELTIKSNIKAIPKFYFFGCISVTQVTIPSSIEKIGEFSFFGCSSLKSIQLPSSLEVIDDFAFYGCSSICEISFLSSPQLKSIGHSAFKGCSSLIEIDIPSSVNYVGDCCFECCSSMQKITLSSSITKIGVQTFRGCLALKEIKIPSSVTEIGPHSFDECFNLENIEIPSSVVSIGSFAFRYCLSLKEKTIPPFVKNVGEQIFGGPLIFQNFEHEHYGEYYIITKDQLIDAYKSSIIEPTNIINYKKNGAFDDSDQYRYLYLVTNKITQEKLVDIEFPIDYTESDLEKIIQQIKIKLTLNNPTFIRLNGFSLESMENILEPVLLMDYINKPDLFEMLNNNSLQQLDNTSKQIILIGLARAFMILHDFNINDLCMASPCQIIIDEKGFPYLPGYDLLYIYSEAFPAYGGRFLKNESELFDFKNWKELNVFSFGILAYQIIIGELPPHNKLNRFYFMRFKEKYLQFSSIQCSSLKMLIQRCCNPDPKMRPTFKEIFNALSYDHNFWLEHVNPARIADYVNRII